MYQCSEESELIRAKAGDRYEYNPIYSFNTMNPNRTRIENIYSTVLGNSEGSIICPKIISLGLDFGENIPVEWMGRLLWEEGFTCPEELRRNYLTVQTMCVCHKSRNPAPIQVANAPRKLLLHQALLLGLCTATFFDPSRPVIWTNTSLTRCVDLYNMQGFYL